VLERIEEEMWLALKCKVKSRRGERGF